MKHELNSLQSYWETCCRLYVSGDKQGYPFIREEDNEAAKRKVLKMAEREAIIVKNNVDGYLIQQHVLNDRRVIDYFFTIEQFIIHKDISYLETQRQFRRAVFEEEQLIDDYILAADGHETVSKEELYRARRKMPRQTIHSEKNRFSYDRLEAVKYAERWWNDYNPAYKQFDNDCTNYVSQCLRAGGAPMRGAPNRKEGWWYGDSKWSFSWAVAHSLRWYLSGSEKGLKAEEVSSAQQLMKGDIICYDFTGDGSWQHTTVVVEKDADQMPLVNAHTTNSRMRYWGYEDSTAWTPNIQYKFFHITG
ncbi:amidase domain-containing protein [Salipaludibacillus agaradhaerens]|jgi:hypothetical protein|uniref:amidase domain-containing protein n=1 Tax=Salipaludibacillus agaradhaerens TaxID=76935 RepID=UPI000998A25B|nr:amidase domain-containing protein [Salipaludibacillus agaradhaerens]